MFWLITVFLFLLSGSSSVLDAQEVDGYVEDEEMVIREGFQSPINLSKKQSYKKQLAPLYLTNESDRSAEFILENTGSTVQVNFPQGSGLYIEGGPLGEDVYEVNNLHFHWGPGLGVGSEHTVDNRRYEIEAHVVHYNTKYGRYENAANKRDGLAVIGVFGEAGRGDNPELAGLVSLVPLVTNPNATTVISAGDALDWLGAVLGVRSALYFTYFGSLTTPPFTENVRWIVFPQSAPFSNNQIQPFRNTLKNDFTVNSENYRELQPQNNREVILTRTRG